jgi:hypothetical protein
MADIFWDGFDKYGPVNQVTGAMTPGLFGEWTSGSATIVAGRFAGSYAVQVSGNSSLLRTLPNNYGRLIGGIAIQPNLANYSGVNLYDGTNRQCSIGFNSSGKLILTNGDLSGTVLATASGSITSNSWHYLEWDITLGASGAYTVWLDGVQQFTGTGNTKTTSNSYANGIGLETWTGGVVTNFDDMYLFDNTGSANNAVRGDSRVETLFPTADAAVQFTLGQGVIGAYWTISNNTSDSPGANVLYLRRFTPSVSGTLQSLSVLPMTTSATANVKPVVYADNGGAPGNLLSSGAQVTGTTTGTALTMALTTPQTLTAGTPLWLGYITDTSINLERQDNNTYPTNAGYSAGITYASGAPATAPAMSSGRSSYMLWGNVTGIAGNWSEENALPPGGDLSCVTSNTVGAEDRYNFGILSSTPTNIAGVKVSALMRKSDAGARTVTLQLKSGATEVAGSAQAPSVSYTYLSSYFDTDPNTGAAWTASAVNSLSAGAKIAS